MKESPFKGKNGIERIIRAFFNSVAGLSDAYRHESAFRQELLGAAILIPVAFLLPLTALEHVALIASVMMVMIVELLNSSVEAAIDRIGLDHHLLSKRAKDIGSAAVLVSLVLLLVTWGLIAGPLAVAYFANR